MMKNRKSDSILNEIIREERRGESAERNKDRKSKSPSTVPPKVFKVKPIKNFASA